MPDEDAITNQAIGHFLEEDYLACVEALDQIQRTVLIQWQLLIIGLQRLNRPDLVEAAAEMVLGRPDDYPWEHRLFELTLGSADPESVIAAAESETQRAEALWYAAERRFTFGDAEGAEKAYRAAAAIDVECNERILAAIQLERLLAWRGDQLLQSGDNAGAARVLEELVARVEGGPRHAEALWQLAVAHRLLGNLEHAETLLRRSLTIRLAPEVVVTLASVRAERGNPADAVRLLEGIERRDRLTTYNLAELKLRLGDLDAAARLLDEIRREGDRLDALAGALRSAIELRRGKTAAAFTAASAAFAIAVEQPLERDQISVRLLSAALAVGRLDAAAEALDALFESQRRLLRDSRTVNTVRGRARIARYTRQFAELALSVMADRIGTFPDAGPRLCEILLGSKNIATRLAGEYTAIDAEIAEREMDGPGRDAREHHAGLEELRDRRDEMELRLARTRESAATPDVARIAAAVPAGHVLIEYARFRCVDIRPEGPHFTTQQQYLAVVLPARGTPVAVLFGDAAPVDAAIAEYRQGVDDGIDEKLLHPLGGRIRELIFDPLRPHLAGSDRLIIAPDGEIGAIALEVLSNGDGHLIDSFRFRYLGCAAELAVERTPPDGEPQPSVVMAAPDYGTPRLFPALGGARQEGELVAARLGVAPITGAAATKARLQKVESPRILHLATHGFYLPSHAYDLYDLTGSTAYLAAEDLKDGRLSGERIVDPYLRSGLALTGANAWVGFDEPPPGAGTGLMTAADVQRMRLHATELVVLSACETALGQAKNLEGTTSLRQAFLAAGARALISSVWLVPDRQAPTFFATFYDYLLRGEESDEALRLTQLETRKVRKHPKFWGGFVHYGVT